MPDTPITQLPTFPRPADLAEQIVRLREDRKRYRRLWAYYRNSMSSVSDADSHTFRPYRQAQEWGLPQRIVGTDSGDRKEVVIENDIGWRIDTMADYLFGKPVVIDSAAPDPQRRAMLSELMRAIFAANGGVQFLQQLTLIGAVYGFVDLLVKFDPHALDEPLNSTCATQELGDPPCRMTTGTLTPDGPGPSAGPSASDGCPVVLPNAESASCATVASAQTKGESPSQASATGPSPSLESIKSTDTGASKASHDPRWLQRIARMIRFEIVEPARALPLLSVNDFRAVDAYAQVYNRPPAPPIERPTSPRGRMERWRAALFSPRKEVDRASGSVQVVDLITPTHWARFEDDQLLARGCNSLGIIPLVHIQNVAMPFQYAGASDVEPLIPLQDELNTRLSDRASRIALQSFRMYLGKGVENFTQQGVGPGRMWSTDNPDAEVISFGGDTAAPSEDLHIADVREAMDKTSGVTPIAAGAIKGRIGRLTSAAALRITLLSLLAKNERKRTTYGSAIQRMAELALAWLDTARVLHTAPEERRVEIHWPSPLPENDIERLQEAEMKLRLGIPQPVVLRELGY